MTNYVEHLFMYLLAIYISSLGQCLIQVLYLFLNWVNRGFVCFLLFIYVLVLSCVSSLHILGTNPYHIYDLQISSPIQYKLSFHFVSGFIFCVEDF